MPLILRSTKGSPLTFNELDGNFTYLSESIAEGGGGGTPATASYALTAGAANSATSASYALTAGAANSATSASYALNATNAVSASYAPSSNPFPYIGNAQFSGSVLVSGSIIPNVSVGSTSSFNLGSPTAAWKDIYVSNGTINLLDGAGNVQGTIGAGTNATVITGSFVTTPSSPLTGFGNKGTFLQKSYTSADCAFALYDFINDQTNPGVYTGATFADGRVIVLPWDKKITAYSLVNNIPLGDTSTSTVVSLPPIYNAGYSTGETITLYNLGKSSPEYKGSGSIYVTGIMQGVTNVNTFNKTITGVFNTAYVLSGSWGNYTQINYINSATTESIKINPGQKATFEIVFWGDIYATPSASMTHFYIDGYNTNYTNIDPSSTFTRYLFKGIENL
jgi:hypothetical protein